LIGNIISVSPSSSGISHLSSQQADAQGPRQDLSRPGAAGAAAVL